MAHNPVQVVLNTKQYMKKPDGGGGGGNKDFFEGRDAEFVRHKKKILKDVEAVQSVLAAASGRPLGYVKVRLQSAALAKSHRPLDAIFKPTQFPLVGTGALGELYFEVTPSALNRAVGVIKNAEDEVTRRNKKNELQASSARAEVGAIEAISLPDQRDKRGFSFPDARKHFEAHPAGRYLLLDLFVDERLLKAQPNARPEAMSALANFKVVKWTHDLRQ